METYDLPGGGLLGRAATGERKGLRLPSLFASDLLLERSCLCGTYRGDGAALCRLAILAA